MCNRCGSDRHKANGSESRDEILHVISQYRLFALTYGAKLSISLKATLNQPIPVLGLNVPRTVGTGIPSENFVLADEVLLRRPTIPAEIAARRFTFHRQPPFSRSLVAEFVSCRIDADEYLKALSEVTLSHFSFYATTLVRCDRIHR